MSADLHYTVAVRTLCEFTAKSGDLDLRFTPSPSGQEGVAGHAAVRARRKKGYRAEISLSGEFENLRVRGRADGYDPDLNQVEEIKTYRGELDAMPANHRALHWAQAKMYGHLLCKQLELAEIRVALVYYEIDEQTETVLDQVYPAAELEAFFRDQCGRFLAWAEQEAQHVAARNEAAQLLRFPHASFRSGQRELAAAVYKTAIAGSCLLAQAPTGIGKTVGTLFPLLKALHTNPAQGLDKIFYLAAKTSGRQLALDAAAAIKYNTGGAAQPLRVLELVARDKACEHPDKACHGDSCPLAKGFYDRLPAARSSLVARGQHDRDTVRAAALAHQICPYYLSQEMARWADVIVGDYNYYFDVGAMLHGLTLANDWRVAVLVDEAHNLVERARKMYSAELDQADLKSLRAELPSQATMLKKPLEKLNRAWNALCSEQEQDYRIYAAVPESFVYALTQTLEAIGAYQTEHPTAAEPRLQQFYFDALHFFHLTESFDEHSLFDIAKPTKGSSRHGATLGIRNIVPSPFLKPRFAAAQTSTLFSATLNPSAFYCDMLGLPEETLTVDVPSPFRAEQLSVKLVSHISTRYRERDRSLGPIADLIAQQFDDRPGNYLAFFSSFDYLQAVLAHFQERYPHISAWVQERRMAESERTEFLARFTEGGAGVGFAVLGGAFAEGIDLPGERLIGAFIATLGLPQLNPFNEQVRERMQAGFGAGYEYAYLYPGLQKVVQAAGRVIRTTSDRGCVYLIDDRFARREVRALLPEWWDVKIL
ncbi:MAG: ATP-dependent DNA helicase [Burkholderiaceae bacterium]|nr:ATP-dependent DNA helicase [Burkholderiaceae bacterium]